MSPRSYRGSWPSGHPPVSGSIVDNLRRSAALHAGRTAIKAPAGSISYGELLCGAATVAAFLESHGLGVGDRVALILPNGIEYVVACYGALMAGAIVVPMNSAAKSRDFEAWLGHSEPRWLIAQNSKEVTAALQRFDRAPQVIWVGEAAAIDGHRYEQVLQFEGTSLRQPALQSEQPANILYTSGTTGRPKGVLLSHGNLASNTDAIVSYLGLRADDSIVTVLPFHYSYGSSVLHSHLQAGGQIILERNFMYPHLVMETIARERASGFAGVPSTYALLLSRVKLADYDLSCLRYVTQAGGAMSPLLADRLREALPETDVIVMYGQTEATARLTYLPPGQLHSKPGSVGITIPGVRIEVRDESDAPVAAGETGEVWAKGPNVMLGYWHDPDASNAVLRDGWLKTGDMGYMDADGYLYLVGRRTDMIKVGAHRIHPKDIEEAIAGLPGIQEAVVVGMDDEILGQAIHAFVVLEPGADLDAMRIQGHCREHLASYKVPKRVRIVSSLPKTASGKVRRAELLKEV